MTIPAEAREGTGGSAARAPESLSLFQMVDYLESGTPFQIVDHPGSGTPLVDADFFFFFRPGAFWAGTVGPPR